MAKEHLKELLESIYRSGQEHDSQDGNHGTRMLNITPDTGKFLAILVQSCGARDILEIGTSNGYSTLWLADGASRTGGRVRTVEVSESKYRIAAENFRRSGIGDSIELILEDIRSYITKVEDGSIDFLFLDSERPQYMDFWEELDRVLKKDCLMVVDNALSPKPEELNDFIAAIENSKRYSTQIIDIGKGELLALKLR